MYFQIFKQHNSSVAKPNALPRENPDAKRVGSIIMMFYNLRYLALRPHSIYSDKTIPKCIETDYMTKKKISITIHSGIVG